jgi:hypothetical protein
MNGAAYLHTHEQLCRALREAEAGTDAGALDAALAALDAFVASLMTDPRKLRALAVASRAAAADVLDRAQAIDLPRSVLDPVHDVAFARLWLASLSDSQLRLLAATMADESRRRAPPEISYAAAPRGAYRRMRPALSW